MKLGTIGVAGFFRQLMPRFVEAGRVACRIQEAIASGRASSVEQKSGGPFSAALTDADILVEGFLGMAVLSDYEDVAFHGEERALDRISTYFPSSAPYLVTLDPIDGTRYFMDGLPLWSIIMTVCHEGRMIGALAYLPLEGRFYVGLGTDGARTMNARSALDGGTWSPYKLVERTDIVLVGDDDLKHRGALQAAGFHVVHGNSQYRGQSDWRYGSIRLLSGMVVGLAGRQAQLIDAGAIAFIAASAGGKDNATVYDMGTMLAPRILAAGSPETYDKLAAIVGET